MNNNGHKKRGPEDLVRLLAPTPITPDQGCFAAIIGSVLLLISIVFWLIVYLRNAQEFQPSGSHEGPPTSQIQREREDARKGRLNR